jgi:hypothetical protein
VVKDVVAGLAGELAAAGVGTTNAEAVELLTAKDSVIAEAADVEIKADDGCDAEICKEVVDVTEAEIPRAKVVPILSSEIVEEMTGVAVALGDTRGKVSTLLPEATAVVLDKGSSVVDGTVEVTLPVWLNVLLAVASSGVLVGFAAGTEGNDVNGGEAPGSLGTAATIPTIPEGLTGISEADEATCDDAAGLGEDVAAERGETVLSMESVLAAAAAVVDAESDRD